MAQYSILFGEAIHAAKLAHASSRRNCVAGSDRSAGSLRNSVVEICIVESGVGCVCGSCAVEDRIEPRPVRCRQAHGAGLATGVKLASGQRERTQCLARGADGRDLAMRRRIVRSGHHVHAFCDDLAVAHNQGCEWAASAGGHVLCGQRDGTAQKLEIGLDESYLCLPSALPNGESKHSMAQALRSTRVLTAEGLMPAVLIVDGEKIVAVRAWDEVAGCRGAARLRRPASSPRAWWTRTSISTIRARRVGRLRHRNTGRGRRRRYDAGRHAAELRSRDRQRRCAGSQARRCSTEMPGSTGLPGAALCAAMQTNCPPSPRPAFPASNAS